MNKSMQELIDELKDQEERLNKHIMDKYNEDTSLLEDISNEIRKVYEELEEMRG